MKVVKNNEMVGHLPREFSRTAWYFLARSGEISVEVTGRRRHSKHLCRGMEIPCQLEFNCSINLSANQTLERTTEQDSGLGATTSTESSVSICLILSY